MLPTSNTIPHAPLFCQGPFLSRASPREQRAAPMGSAQSRRQPQKPHNRPKSSGSGKPTRAESAAAPPLFLLGGAALAFCPCLLRQGAHPEGTGPLPWPVGPAGPRAGLARRQSVAAQLGPLYDGGAKLGRHFKRGRARQVAPAGLYLPWGASARPLGWRPGGACGHGGACGRGPHHQRQLPLVALLGAPL